MQNRLHQPRAAAQTTLTPKEKAAQVLAKLNISPEDLKTAGANPNHALEEVICQQCNQITHKFDFQSPPGKPQWLHWYRKQGDGNILKWYNGVCYKCFDTRRSYFKQYTDEQLMKEIKERN